VIKASGGIASDNDVKRIALDPARSRGRSVESRGQRRHRHAVNQSWWISYVGHGGTLTWGGTPTCTTRHVLALPANDNQPIVFASACETERLRARPHRRVRRQDGRHWFLVPRRHEDAR